MRFEISKAIGNVRNIVEDLYTKWSYSQILQTTLGWSRPILVLSVVVRVVDQ
jgi:hypothetical protein